MIRLFLCHWRYRKAYLTLEVLEYAIEMSQMLKVLATAAKIPVSVPLLSIEMVQQHSEYLLL